MIVVIPPYARERVDAVSDWRISPVGFTIPPYARERVAFVNDLPVRA